MAFMIREEIWMQSYMITSLYLTVLSVKTVFDLPDWLHIKMYFDNDDNRWWMFLLMLMMMALLMMMMMIMMMMMHRVSVDEFVMFYGLTKVFKVHLIVIYLYWMCLKVILYLSFTRIKIMIAVLTLYIDWDWLSLWFDSTVDETYTSWL